MDPLDSEKTRLPDEDGPAASLRPGETLGQYRIVRLLGRGGMGEVYEAEHQVLRKRYALKILSPEIIQRPEARARFEREAMVMAQLKHDRIVLVDEYGVTGGHTWLRMELMEGTEVDGQRCVSLVKSQAVIGLTADG